MARTREVSVAAFVAALPAAAQDLPSAEGGTDPSAVGAVVGMALVLALAWAVTRWIARPLIRRLGEEPDPVVAPSPPPHLTSGDIELDPLARRVLVAGEPVTLTATEFDLLCFLLQHPGEVVSREALLREVWGHQQPVYSRTVDTHIQRLRDKLGVARDQLETVRGAGYCLRETLPPHPSDA